MYVDENNDEDILFQILEWDSSHEDDEDGQLKFIVRLFGKTKDNKNIYIQTSDFEPYFFVELDKKWTESTIHMILKKIKSMVKPELVKGLKKTKIISKHKFYGFTNYEKFNFLQLIFSDHVSMKSYANTIMNRPIYIPMVSRKPIKLKVYESNIEPLMRLMHIRNLDAVGWVKINKKKYKTHKGPLPPSVCEKNIECRWTELNRVDDRTIQKFDICAFDIECTSEDGSFPNPQRDGDKVIQIGLTFSKFGDDECYYKHILTLGETSDVEGATVEWFETEEELLLGFTKIINKLNPDVLTGYNIFGFDFKYLMNRANKLDIYPKFSRLSRIKGEISEFVSQILKSSALGKNELYYYKMVGRIVIDLMKVIQRDFKLPSYKLDDVASFFIREEIKNFDNSDKNYTKIITKSTNGVYVGDYIKIGYNDGITENKHMDGEKFQIIEMTKTSLLVKRQINFDEIWGKGYKVFWCQSKDDVKPSELFALQKGSAKDRAIIAKYCLMDCSLCNKLMGKLQILTNNIGMANVCHVPLSYLFLRGQGVKIFSLVSKKCREEEHLIPVIKKKKKDDKIVKDTERIEKYLNTNKNNDYEDDEDDNGYEGATVFPPEKGLHTDPVPVLDYASLYPNSMILRNLSHEMLINDEKYDNIPGYRYHQIMFKNSNNTTSSCKFAERIDPTGLTQKKGIIPVILMELLAARKRVRAEAANTENKFLASILEGLQLAFKCTANSLYGQTGAPTSPIFMKEIAASTTATGREALQFSRYFIENIFYKMVEYALNNKKKYMEYSNNEYINYPHMIKTTMVFGDIFKNYKNIFIAMGFNIFGIEQKFRNTFENVSQEDKFEFYNDIIRLFEENISYTDFCEKQQKYLLTLDFNNKYHQNNEEFEYELNIIKNKLMTEDQLEEFYDDLYFMFYTEFHVHTDKAFPIPEKVFNRKEIGYEFENNIYNIIENELKLLNLECDKLFGRLKELYPDDSKKLPANIDSDNIKKIINTTFNNFIFGGISKMKVSERSTCLNDICDCINGKLKIQAFYDKYSQLCNDIIIKLPELDNKKIISNIIKDMNNDTKNKLILMITNIIKNFGYSGKSEMLEKFYEVVNDILKGYEIKPKVIYGDSVTADTPIMLRYLDEAGIYRHCIKTIDTIGKNWKEYDTFKSDDKSLKNKQNDDNILYEVWTSIGWSKIKRVIKHKTNKKIYEVLSHTGFVRVTEDHSLLTPKLEQIKPKDCTIGTELLHKDLEIYNSNENKLRDNEAYIFGFFFGDGSSGIYDYKKYGRKYSWALNSNDIELCKKLKEYCEKIYGKTFKILNTLKSSAVYKVVPAHGDIKTISTEYSNKLYDKNRSKIIPNEILYGTFENKKEFLKGYYDADGCRKDTEKIGCQSCDTKNQVSAMNLYYLLNCLGYNVSINNRKDKPEIFRLTFSDKKFKRDTNKIKKIKEINGYTDYVYDLETETGNFQAGIGRMIVKNTDSVFFKPTITSIETGEILKDKKGLEISIILGQWASILITTLLPTPMSQEYEKVLWPFAILTKKRYVGNLYEKNPKKYYQKSMGIVLKRRDNAQIVKVVCGGIIDQMLNKNSPEGAVKLTQDCLRQIISGKFKLDKFVITKTLKGPGLTKLEREKESKKNKEDRSYADRTRIVHAVLADRMADRDPGNKPLSNDRIPYVYFETKDEPELQGDRVENPDYLIENNLKIDYLFYITNQIMKPSIQFLELIVENPKDIFNNYIIREENRKKGIIPIMSYFKETDVKNENLFENFFNKKDDIINNKQKKRSVLPKRKQSIIDKKTENKIDYKPFDDDYFDK